MDKRIILGIGVIALVAMAFFFMPGSATGNVVSESGEVIKIPLSEVSNTAKFYNEDGIKFFVVKASDGEIKTAFDACDVCGGSKGYRQEGGDMVCNNCGRHFAIDQLGEKNIYGGGCWPGYLESSIEGDFVVIKKSDLENGGYNF